MKRIGGQILMNNNTQILHEKAKGLACDYLRTKGELLSVLMEMRRQRVFAELNYSGIFEYCEKALNLSRAQAYYFKTVAEKAEEVPRIKAAIVQGELTLSQARRITSVVTNENQEVWIDRARTLSQKDLEKEVAFVNPKARIHENIKPIAKEMSQLKVAVNEQTEKNLNVLKEVLSQKLGKPATLGDVIAWAAEVTREKFDPLRKAERAVSWGKTAPVVTQKGRAPVPALTKHQLNLRDRAQCTFIGSNGRRCEQRRWIDVHHTIPVARGGLNNIENLTLRCKAHHAFAHAAQVYRM